MNITQEQYLEAQKIVIKYERKFRISGINSILLPELREEAKNKRSISIPDFIKRRSTHWRQVDAWRGAFEELIKNSDREEFSIYRTSEIFVTGRTKRGERNLRYFPVHRGCLISHIIFRNTPK